MRIERLTLRAFLHMSLQTENLAAYLPRTTSLALYLLRIVISSNLYVNTIEQVLGEPVPIWLIGVGLNV